ncbi:translocation/assembly module TamB domain-containing protein [Limimaricola hongkongensis]|uniref:Translocation and assembly module TamB C-terminal domain-containing protein n=1 Tax=Limimaricola hongkongensis DSM 17492 TaxID=1122180 RepID=A0A017HET5_9RHOB|nr:translocation/assembly module TamB domain-containing protein [Limimaricola hongkongensis]EYD72643.1 hypothetical protein Lokhon_01444 [Limimaricola hongkongensis DSM 17492]
MKQLSRAAAISIATVAPTMLPAQQEQADRDRGFLTGLIEDNLSGAGREVIITGFQGALSSSASIEVMTIADEEGVWLRAENLVLDWNRSALLRGRLDVEELSAELIELSRPPIAGPGEPPAAEASPFSLPELPVSIRLDELAIDQLILGEAFLDEEITLTVQGSAQLADGEGEAQLTAERLGERTGRFELSGSYSNDSRQLDLTLALDEAENGIAARLLDLPGRPSVALKVEGAGPVDDFDAAISLATDGAPRISGDFALDRGEAPENGPAPLRFSLDVDGDVTPLVAPDYAGFFGPDVTLGVTGSRGPDGALALSRLSISAQALELDGSARIGADGWPERFDLSGRVGGADGGPVTLPVAGGETRIGGAELALQFDASTGDQWVIDLTARDFARPGLTIPQFTVQGGGVIVGATDAAPSLFTADVDYTARGLQFDDADLAEALGQQIAGEIVLERDGDGPVMIDRVTLDGPGIALDAKGTVAGAENGFETETTLSLEAERLERFSGLTGLDLAGAADLDIDSTIRPLDGIFDVTLSGGTQDLALGIEPLDPYIGGAGEIALRAARDETGTRIDDLRIATPEMTATAQADITSGASAAEFDISVENAGFALDGVTGPASLTGTASRDAAGVTTADVVATLPNGRAVIDATQAAEEDGGQVTLDMTADLRDVAPFSTIAGRELSGAADFSARGTLASDASTFDLVIDAATTDLVTGVTQADPLLRGQAALSGRAVRSGPESFRVENFDLTSQSLTATGRAELNGTTAIFDIDATAADLGPVGEAVDRPLSGAIDLSASGRMQTDLSQADITIDATATDLVTGIDQADPLLRGRVALSGRATRSGAESFSVEDLVLDGPAIAATGRAEVIEGLAEFDLDLDARDLSAVGEAVDRPLAGEARLSASGSAALDASSFDVTLDGRATDLATGEDAADALFGGTLSLSGHAVRSGPEDFMVENLRVTAQGLDVTGAAMIENGSGDFDLDLDIDDLAPVGTLAGRPLSGAVDLSTSGTASADLSRFEVTLDGTATDVTTGIDQLDPLLVGETVLDARTIRSGPQDFALPRFELSNPQIRASGNATVTDGLPTGDFDIRLAEIAPFAPGLSGPATVAATASGDAQGGIDFEVTGTAQGTDIAATGRVAPEARGREITARLGADIASLAPFSQLAGRPLGGSVDLDAAGTLMPDLSAFDVTVDGRASDLDIGVEAASRLLDGSGTIDARLSRDAPGEIAVRDLDIRFPAFSVQADATGTGSDQSASFTARLNDIGIFTPDFTGPVTATGTAARNAAGDLDLDVTATGPGGTSADVAGRYLSNGTLDLGVTGQAQLGLVNDLIAPRRLDGTARFDLRLDGPPALSSLTGTISTADAQLAVPTVGLTVQDIDTTIALSGNRADLALSAALEKGGRLSVSGPVALTGGFDADLVIALDDLELRDPELYETTADGRLSVTGPLAGGALIAGLVELGPTEIQVPSSGIGALGDLPQVRHVNAPQAVQRTLARAGLTIAGVDIGAAAAETQGPSGPGYGLDVTIRAPSRIFIRGRGLDAELGGELEIGGSTNQVIPVGEFELIRGRLDILQQRFELDEGGAFLQGDFSPFIRLVATTETATGTRVRIIIEGPASAPEVRFESTPDLPQDEVLSQLIFGRDLSSISPLQAVQLAAAVGTLAGRGGGGLIDDFRAGTGLDDLDITTDDEGNAALRAGKYLSENIYTDVTVGTDQTSINLNLDVTDDIKAQGRVSSDGETSLGVFFERDY